MIPHIASPCHEAWDAMSPNAQGRHCAVCDKTVVDLAGMAHADAQRYLARDLPQRLAAGDQVCVRAHTDRKRRLLRPGQRLLTNAFAGMLAMTVAGALGMGPMVGAAETPTPDPEPIEVPLGEVEMGDVVAPDPKMGRVACEVPLAPLMGAVAMPAPMVTQVEQLGGPVAVPAESGHQLAGLLREGDGRWAEAMAVPMIAPTATLTLNDGRVYQIIKRDILTGPEGGLRDADLVGRLLTIIAGLQRVE